MKDKVENAASFPTTLTLLILTILTISSDEPTTIFIVSEWTSRHITVRKKENPLVKRNNY